MRVATIAVGPRRGGAGMGLARVDLQAQGCGGGQQPSLFLKQLRMGTRPHEDQGVALQPINQQEIAADVAFAMVRSGALERMIQPFGTKGTLVGNQQQHGFFQTLEVVTARAGKPLPVLEKGFGVIARLGR